MSVGAVSSSYTYSTSYATFEQYKFFHAVISNSQVQELLRKYGVVPSGDSYTDLHALYEVLYAQASKDASEAIGSVASQQTQNTQKPQPEQNSTEAPWATLMSQIGLKATGNLGKDYASFDEKISMMMASALTPQDKANISQLQSQASVVFVENKKQSTQSTSSAQNNTQQATPIGVDIMAMLNRLYAFS